MHDVGGSGDARCEEAGSAHGPGGHGAAGDQPDDVAPVTFWEERYAGSDRVWSGRANHTLVEVARTLAPGRALDLGCGEGGDVLWLARQGWTVTGVDISPTAIRRATAAAEAEGLSESVRFRAVDLDGGADLDEYDLVTASFLHSPVALSRTEVLLQGAGHVAPGGHLLVIGHAAPPPWSRLNHHEHRFLTPEEEVEALALDPAEWTTVLAEVRTRPATSPDGERTTLDDTVVLLRRRTP